MGDGLTEKDVNALLNMLSNPAVARHFADPGSESKAAGMKTTHRCACDKVVPVGELEILKTPYITGLDIVCKSCPRRRDYAKSVKFVCVVCHETVMFHEPFRSPTGFVYHPGYTYHLDCCPNCVAQTSKAGDTIQSKIFEEQAFVKRKS